MKLLTLFALLLICFSSHNEATLAHTPFIIFSPPKAGTFLCGKTLSLITGETAAYHISGLGKTDDASLQIIEQDTQEGKFVVTHHCNPELLKKLVNKGYKIIFIRRDPRDQLLSVQNWLREGQWSWIPSASIANKQAQLTDLITGEIKGWRCVHSCCLAYEKTIRTVKAKHVYITHFEKLVGEAGGGSNDDQQQEVINLANFIQQPLTAKAAEEIATKIYGGTKTFRKGAAIGKWKTEFTPVQKKLFNQRYGYLLTRLGYEKQG